MAARSPLTFLITGPSGDIVETVARRIHTVRFDDAAPFVAMRASLFPCHPERLQQHLAKPIERAAGGSLVLREPPLGCRPAVRLIAGTTVSLLERIGAGHFLEGLFYRLM